MNFKDFLNESSINFKGITTHTLKVMLEQFNEQAKRTKLNANELKWVNAIVYELHKRGEEV